MTGADAAVWATAIIGAAVTLTSLIIKAVPRRLVNGAGERFALQVELVELRARTATLERDVVRESKYVHDSIHDIRDYLQGLEKDLIRAGVAQEVRQKVLHAQRLRQERIAREESEME